MTMGGMYGNVGTGKNVFGGRYAKQMTQIGIQRQEQWESISSRQKELMFRGIEPPTVKVMANWHIWDRPNDPDPEVTIQPGHPIPKDLKLPNIDYMTIDKFLDLKGDEGVLYHLLIDEPYAWGLDARRSGTDIALEMTRKALQSRKTGKRGTKNQASGSDIFYFTQLPSSMDKRLKFLARSVFLALPSDEYGYHYLYMGKVNKVVHIEMGFAVKNIYPYYDTYEKIEMSFSPEFMENAGMLQAGRQMDDNLMAQAITKVTNDVCMVTKDGIRLWKSMVRPDVWEEELKKGGIIQNVIAPPNS